ncbi:MAG: anti-sigma factor [Opitutaceae bacterium]
MIDDHHEELASLYALGLLEGAELASFEQELAQDPALARLVSELRESTAQLAFTAPAAAPSPALRARLLDELDTAAKWRAQGNVIAFRTPIWLPWAAAAGFAIACAWLGQLYVTSRFEAANLRDQQTLAEFKLKSANNQMEAERLVATHQLGAATEQLAALDRQLKAEGDLAKLKIATLASLAGNSPQALAVAVWSPLRQEGVLNVEKLPALAADKDYQLWLVDPQYPIPVDGGVFTVDPATGDAHITFKANRPINSVAKFAVSLERKGGVPKAEGPMVLLSQ